MSIDIELFRIRKPDAETVETYNGDTVDGLQILPLEEFKARFHGDISHILPFIATKKVKLVEYDKIALEVWFRLPKDSYLESVNVYHEDGKRMISFNWLWFNQDEDEIHVVKNVEVGTLFTKEYEVEVALWYEESSMLHWSHRADIRKAVYKAYNNGYVLGYKVPITEDIYNAICQAEPSVRSKYPDYKSFGHNVIYEEW